MKDIIIILIIVLILDFLYLSNIGGKPFLEMVKKIQSQKVTVKYSSAIISYILIILSIKYYAINQKHFIYAFLLGILIYGIFDFTNLALFNKYNLLIAIQDTLWGGVLYMLTYIIYHKII